MGSLSESGSRIVPLNYSFRNIGNAVVSNLVGFPTRIAIKAEDNLPTMSVTGYDDDKIGVVQLDLTTKIVDNSPSTPIVERIFSIAATGYTAPVVPDETILYTSVRQDLQVKTYESKGDTLIGRDLDV